MSTNKYTERVRINPSQGGKAAIERLVEAYGFSTRQALCDHIGVSKSTLANRYLRDTFPSDWIIECALETGASLLWLTTGNGPMYDDRTSDMTSLNKFRLMDGKLVPASYLMFDKAYLPSDLANPYIITLGSKTYLVDGKVNEINDGMWVIEIDGKISIREIIRIPGNKLQVISGANHFECLLDDIKIIASVVTETETF
ncbi:phage repressor protein CI [Serratia ureilytica]|uniref:phage repressor protein CI n=1 Tax=Serratia ureilytica TaxID=300181 RepID=UPI00313C3B01